MVRKIVGAAALTAVILIQLTVVNGLSLPGGGAPDLVLLCVIALGMTGGPASGLVAGFCAGLALDLAPPATSPVGQYALVLCLAGYAAGRLRSALRHSAVLALVAAIAVAAAAEIVTALLTLALDAPEAGWSTIAAVLPRSVLFDVVLSPVLLFCSVRLAIALGVSVDPVHEAPAHESGGSAAPVTVAGLGEAAGATSGAASGRWLIDDVVDTSRHPVGWLAGPPTSRSARRKQAGLAATLTGTSPRSGAFWLGRQRPGWLPGAQARSRRKLAAVNPHGADRHGLTGDFDPGIAYVGFRTGTLARGGPQRRMVPKIPFGTGRAGSAATDGRAAPRIAFGTGGLPGSGRAAGRGVPRIAFGTGGLPGSGRAAGRAVPRIAFGSAGPGLAGHRLHGGQPRPAAPRFRSAASSRSAARPWLAGAGAARGAVAFVPSPGPPGISSTGSAGTMSFGPLGTGYRGYHGIGLVRPRRGRKQPRFARAVASQRPARPRQPKTPRIRGRRGPFGRLPWMIRAGDRSTVWRIGTMRKEGWR